jgi:hypothetical protein
LSTTQLAGLSTTNLRALETADIQALTTAQISGLDTTTLGNLSMTQADALTSTQIQAMSIAQIEVLTTSPLVLDLNGDGVHTVGKSAGVAFDLDGSGHVHNVGWVSASDGFLALDRNHDGKINSGAELFGTAFRKEDGNTARDGFDALQSLDSNSDGVIDSQDGAYNELSVWVDGNQNGATDPGELQSLDSLGIVRLDVDAHSTSIVENGNWIGLESNFTTADGTAHALADVWLAMSKATGQVTDLTKSEASQLDVGALVGGDLSHIDLGGAGGHADTLIIDTKAVERFGQHDLVVNDQTGSGHVQLMIQGDANDTVKMTDAEHWTNAGTTVVNGETYEVLNDGDAQLLIGVKLHHDPTG